MFVYLLALFLTLAIVNYWRKMNYWKNRGLPGQLPSPIMGLEFLFQSCDYRKINLERSKKYGKVYGSYLGTLPIIMVSDPEIAKEILIKQFWNFSDRNPITFNIKYLNSTFLFKKGQDWKTTRARVSPVFTTKRIKDIFLYFEVAAKQLFENIEEKMKEQPERIDVKDLFKCHQLDVIGKFVYALQLNSSKEQDHPFAKNVRQLISASYGRAIRNIVASTVPKFMIEALNIQFVDESIEKLAEITRCLMKQRQESNTVGNYHDFIDLLVGSFKDKHQEIAEDEIIGNAIIFLFAGLETVANTLANALYALIMNPQCQEKLHDELVRIYPDKRLTYENLNDSPLLEATLKETQRIRPTVHLLLRKVDNPVCVKGVQFKSGDAIGIDLTSLHNSEDYWREPEKFYPERFLENKFKIEGDESMLFLPFGAGPRSCVASRLAFIQCKYVLGQIILNYEVYRTKFTRPPQSIRAPQAANFKSMIMGIRKRDS